jgi:hypothetical protein
MAVGVPLPHAAAMPGVVLVDLLAAVACGGLVGVALGLTGGGGSIFAVPLLIYPQWYLPRPRLARRRRGVAR